MALVPSTAARQQQHSRTVGETSDASVEDAAPPPSPARRIVSDMATLAELRAQARRQMDEAVQQIPLERKEAYLEAIKKAPYLFESETDPLLFLRRCDYNIWAAAERICAYWEERKTMFGPDRAFLPMVLTGDGALSKDDCRALKSGLPCVLPETSSGERVIYADRRQRAPSCTVENHLRGLFYIVSRLAEEERNVTQGILFCILLVSPRHVRHVVVSTQTKLLGWLNNIFPIKVRCVHLLNALPKQAPAKKQYLVQDVISTWLSTAFENKKVRPENMEVHFEREEGDLLNAMIELGLAPEKVPRALGGSWDFTEFSKWCIEQISVEREKYKWLLKAAKKERPSKKENRTDQDKAVKKRLANVVHSRRTRERRKQDMLNIQEEHDQLQKEQLDLQKEEARLQDLLHQANTIVATTCRTTGSSPSASQDDHDRKPRPSAASGHSGNTYLNPILASASSASPSETHQMRSHMGLQHSMGCSTTAGYLGGGSGRHDFNNQSGRPEDDQGGLAAHVYATRVIPQPHFFH